MERKEAGKKKGLAESVLSFLLPPLLGLGALCKWHIYLVWIFFVKTPTSYNYYFPIKKWKRNDYLSISMKKNSENHVGPAVLTCELAPPKSWKSFSYLEALHVSVVNFAAETSFIGVFHFYFKKKLKQPPQSFAHIDHKNSLETHTHMTERNKNF